MNLKATCAVYSLSNIRRALASIQLKLLVQPEQHHQVAVMRRCDDFNVKQGFCFPLSFRNEIAGLSLMCAYTQYSLQL